MVTNRKECSRYIPGHGVISPYQPLNPPCCELRPVVSKPEAWGKCRCLAFQEG